MEIVRWGILSTAHINRRVIPAINASKRGKLIAVASREKSKAEKFSADWNIPVSFGTYEALIESDLIDALYISLPNHLHAEWSIRAMQAGKHVLCEKPIALSLDEIDHMIETSKKTNRVLTEAFMYRHHPQTKIAETWIKEGRLGDVFSVQAVFNFLLEKPGDVRRVPEFGGGSLWDVGVYPVSFANMVFQGNPDWVRGVQISGITNIDESFFGLLTYSNNRYAQISSSFQSPLFTRAAVVGTQGILFFSRPFTGMDLPDRKLIFQSNKDEVQELIVPEEYLYAGEIEDMHSAILEGKPPYLSLEESRLNVNTILSLYNSAKQNREIQILPD